ncbi:MAG: DUF2760 domain-containing protein [Desulfobacteraceae bacterium]|nr:DUF2760 domain-containing protein [Desulfobacteraceae bacterium]
MDIVKAFSRRSLAWLLCLNLFLFAIVCIIVYFAFCAAPADNATPWVRSAFYPVTVSVFVLTAIVQWAVLAATLKRLLAVRQPYRQGGVKEKTRGVGKESETGRKALPDREIQIQYRRYYLHLLSLLQRRGRLLDFLKEDLSSYSDEQIGAAVRGIHENCAGTVEKYLAPRAIIKKQEGEEVTIDSGFDPSAIKVTGNVTGEPPFSGVLRHPGWRAGKLELPVFSDSGDPDVIFPAEVEVS